MFCWNTSQLRGTEHNLREEVLRNPEVQNKNLRETNQNKIKTKTKKYKQTNKQTKNPENLACDAELINIERILVSKTINDLNLG